MVSCQRTGRDTCICNPSRASAAFVTLRTCQLLMTGNVGSAKATRSRSRASFSSAGSINSEWKGAETGRKTVLTPRRRAASSTAPFSPDITTWPALFQLARLTTRLTPSGFGGRARDLLVDGFDGLADILDVGPDQGGHGPLADRHRFLHVVAPLVHERERVFVTENPGAKERRILPQAVPGGQERLLLPQRVQDVRTVSSAGWVL